MIVEDLAPAHYAPGSFANTSGPKEFSVRTLFGAFSLSPGDLNVEGGRRKKGVGNGGQVEEKGSVAARGPLCARGNNEDGFHGSGVELFEEAKG